MKVQRKVEQTFNIEAGRDEAKRPVNAQLQWLLSAYVSAAANQTAVIGDKPTVGTPGWLIEREAMSAIYDRVLAEARTMGQWDPVVADEAMSDVLIGIATSNILANFHHGRSPNPYINRIINRTVQRLVYRRWKDQMNAASLPVQLIDLAPSPLQLASAAEMECACNKLLKSSAAPTAADPAPPVKNHKLPQSGAGYVRKHRSRKREWAKVSHLFPDSQFRPPKRRLTRGKN